MSGTTFSKLPVMIVALVIGLILIFTAVMPLVSDYSDDKTFTNNGLWRMSAFDDDQTWTYGDGSWKLNNVTQISGDVVTNNSGSNAVLGDNWLNRANGWIRGETITGNATEPITIVSGDTVQVSSDGGSNYTTVNKSGFGVDNNGNYLMTAYNTAVYVLGDSPIYATGQSTIGTGRCIVHFEGSIKNGITGAAYAIKNDTYSNFSVTNIQIDSEEISGFINLYKLNKITATVSFEDSEENTLSGTVTYSSYVVPYEITAEKDNPAAYKNLVSVLPLFALILLVAGAASLVYFKNKD